MVSFYWQKLTSFQTWAFREQKAFHEVVFFRQFWLRKAATLWLIIFFNQTYFQFPSLKQFDVWSTLLFTWSPVFLRLQCPLTYHKLHLARQISQQTAKSVVRDFSNHGPSEVVCGCCVFAQEASVYGGGEESEWLGFICIEESVKQCLKANCGVSTKITSGLWYRAFFSPDKRLHTNLANQWIWQRGECY